VDRSGKVGGTSYFDNSQTLVIDGGRGLRAGVERRWGRHGLELSYEELTFDSELTATRFRGPTVPAEVARSSGDFTVRPLSLAWLVHASFGGRADLFAGPALSRVSYAAAPGPGRDSEIGYGGVVGVEVPVAEGWAAGVTARYLEVVHETVDRDYWGGLGLLSLAAGVSYRF
jgi:hypothetical protein